MNTVDGIDAQVTKVVVAEDEPLATLDDSYKRRHQLIATDLAADYWPTEKGRRHVLEIRCVSGPVISDGEKP